MSPFHKAYTSRSPNARTLVTRSGAPPRQISRPALPASEFWPSHCYRGNNRQLFLPAFNVGCKTTIQDRWRLNLSKAWEGHRTSHTAHPSPRPLARYPLSLPSYVSAHPLVRTPHSDPVPSCPRPSAIPSPPGIHPPVPTHSPKLHFIPGAPILPPFSLPLLPDPLPWSHPPPPGALLWPCFWYRSRSLGNSTLAPTFMSAVVL